MSDFDINQIRGKARIIADKIDNKNVKNGKLNALELSIFLAECKKEGIEVEKESWYSKVNNFFKQFNLSALSQRTYVAKNDATYVAPSPEAEIAKMQLMSEEKANAEQAKQAKQAASPSLPEPKTLSSHSSVRTNYEWSEEQFAKVLDQMLNAPRYNGKFKNSVLQGKAKAFIESGKKYNIDPRFLVAISMCESARGVSKKALELNNVGGLKMGGKYHKFETVEASIDSIAKTIDTRYQEGYTTPNQIANSGRYCAKTAAPSWLSDVKSYLGFFDRYYQ